MVRIIGGTAKGTLLKAPAGRSTRPTLARTRESIFNVLANIGLLETRVLDIFAGTGAMGLEALSRGAASATLIDKSTARLLRENAAKCRFQDRTDILGGDVESALLALRGREYDYIFMDPPYRKGYIEKILSLVIREALCADGAVIIIEHDPAETIDISAYGTCLSLGKQKRMGPAVLTYLHYAKTGR